MAELRIANQYKSLPQQRAFHSSKARYRGFGGAMSGGKTRALGEEAFDMMIDHPGISLLVVRQKHTAIIDSTRKTFIEQVLPKELRGRPDLVRIKASGGEDFVEFLWNKSRIGFYGLDDSGKFFSTEFGAAFLDEAHEMDERDVMIINARLRQRCPDCVLKLSRDPRAIPEECTHFPHSMVLTFNPMAPNHWLYKWFIQGARTYEFGKRKDELFPSDSAVSIGDCEFFFSRAADNPYVSERYVRETLGGLPEMMRRRYAEGLWEHISGTGFFDQDALSRLFLAEKQVLIRGEVSGDTSGVDREKWPTIKAKHEGRLEVFRKPVYLHTDNNGEEVRAHRYVMGIDASSGASADYSGIQIIDVDEMEQVAEWQGKVDPDKLAETAFLLGIIYGGALLVPEITGGWGFGVVKALQRMQGQWKGHDRQRPRLYRRKLTDRITDQVTESLGWDTNRKTRAHSLSLLEEMIRDGSIRIHGERTIAELGTFVFPEYSGVGDYGVPRAQKLEHDDMVLSLAIAVTIAEQQSRQRPGGPTTMRLS